MNAWILAARPKTLTAALSPVLMATGVAAVTAPQTWRAWPLCFILLAIFAIQIATNFFNDALDFEKGADQPDRLGPARMTSSGLLRVGHVKKMAMVSVFIALLAGLPLVWLGGIPILLIGLASLFFAYAYTGGPLPLAYNGLGDLFVLIFFGWVAVIGTVYLLLPELTDSAILVAWLAGTQVGLFGVSLIAINNLRDIHNDLRVGKKTFAVLVGEKWARREIVFCLCCPFFLGLMYFGLMSSKGLALLLLPGVGLPLALLPVVKILKGTNGRDLNTTLGQAALVQIVFAILFAVAAFVFVSH